MSVRQRKLSMPLEYKQLSPTLKSNENEDNDFYQKPYARCINCLKYKTRCHRCLGNVLNALKSWKDGQKIKLKEPTKIKRHGKLIMTKKQNQFNISNIALRKTHENTEIVTFQQPVIHKNTILYCVKPFISRQKEQRIKSMDTSPLKYRRNLLVNFSYKKQKDNQNKEYLNQNLTQNDVRKSVSPEKRPNGLRLSTTIMLKKRNTSNISSINNSHIELNPENN